MDYNLFPPPGANQALPFGNVPAQHNAFQQGHPASFEPNYFPYESFQLDSTFTSATNGFPYPPLPDPHAPASGDAGPLPDQNLKTNNDGLDFKGGVIDSEKVGNKGRNIRGTRQGSAATSADEVTPSTDREDKDDPQSRRKAQNRAAQRAFRERKEQRVRGLEDELGSYKNKYAALQKENEELKRQIAKLSTENEILKATAHAPCPKNGENNHEEPAKDEAPGITEPQRYSPMEHDEISASDGPIWPNKTMTTDEAVPDAHSLDDGTHGSTTLLPQRRIKIDKETGERFLDASETWEMIVNYRSKHNVMLDLNDVYGRLRGKTKCDGQGAVIGEEVVKKAIQDSIEAGKDDLL